LRETLLTHTDKAAVHDWRDKADIGDRLIYYVGDLAFDRTMDQELSSMADYVWTLRREGKVTLTQQRVGPNRFRYGAVAGQFPRARVRLEAGCNSTSPLVRSR